MTSPPQRDRYGHVTSSRMAACKTNSLCHDAQQTSALTHRKVFLYDNHTVAALSAIGFEVVEVVEDALCDPEGLEGGRYAAVDRRLQEGLADLLTGTAVVDRAADVRAELVRPVQRGQHAEVDQTAGAAV